MKRFILYLICISMILTGCTLNEKSIIKKMEKKMNKHKGYESILEIETKVEGKESYYKMKEKYIKDKKSIVQMIEPEKSRGITLEYLDDKVIINNSLIEQSITLDNSNGSDRGFLLKDIYENVSSFKLIEERLIEDRKYYVFDYDIDDKNKYTNKRNVFIDKKDFKPYKLDMLDREGNKRFTVYYKEIKILP